MSALGTTVQPTVGFQGHVFRVRRVERFSHKTILGRDATGIGYPHREVGPIPRIMALRVATLSFFSYFSQYHFHGHAGFHQRRNCGRHIQFVGIVTSR